MNVFDIHKGVVADYSAYTNSFINIADEAIRRQVEAELDSGRLWPQPLLQFNPAFRIAGDVDTVSAAEGFSDDFRAVFTGFQLYEHQVEALRKGRSSGFVLTSGTGSGKSLTYFGSIFEHLFATGGSGVVAVVVYPMNALINSQTKELDRYAENYQRATGQLLPFTYGQYTGQESQATKEEMREHPPQILLTNYMMLELLLTRIQERGLRDSIYEHLRFLVFDELHTYRGRQGADIAMLIRRIRAKCKQPLRCIGTSATMSSSGGSVEQARTVAEVATRIFGSDYSVDDVITETLDSFYWVFREGKSGVGPSDALRDLLERNGIGIIE